MARSLLIWAHSVALKPARAMKDDVNKEGPKKELQTKVKFCPHCQKEISAKAKKCPYCQSDLRSFLNRHPILSLVLILLGSSFFLGLAGSRSDSSANSDSTVTPQTSLSPIQQVCQGYSKPGAQTISYKQLEKDPDSFKGKSAIFTGQILEIQESSDGNYMRLAVDKSSYGWNFNDVVLVQYDAHTDALKDDVVTVGGVMEGSQTYTSQANYQITVPLMYGCSIKEGVAKSTSATKTSSTNTPVKTPPVATPDSQTPVVKAPPTPPATWHTV